MERNQNKKSAVVLMLLSALFFSAMQLCSSLCASIPAMEQVFVRNVVSILMYGMVWQKGLPLMGTRKQQPILLGWSVCGCMNVLFLFIAAKGGNQGSLMIIGRTSGFLVVLLAALFLKERVTSIQYLAVVLAIAGGAFTASPSGDLWDSPVILAAAVLSALFSAFASLFLGFLKNKVHALTVAMHFSVCSLVISAPFLLFDCAIPSGVQLAALAAIGIFGGLGQLTQMWAYERAPVSEINIYGYAGILFSMAMGRLFLNEAITAASAAGGALILAAGVLSYIKVGNGRAAEPSPRTVGKLPR